MSASADKCRRVSATMRGGVCALSCSCLLATAAVQAQPGPAASPAPGATSATHEFGRLFFTPERRQQLDRLRELKIEEKQTPEADATFTIDGIVTRSSGKRTVWINGAAFNDGDQANGVAVGTSRRSPGQVVVRPSDAPAIPARVGDTVNRSTGKADGLLGTGRINSRSDDAR